MNGQTLLKRMIATVGLLLMFPIGLQLVQGTLTPNDAAIRAAAVFVAVWIGRSLAALAPGGPTVLLPAEPVAVNESS
ncbi:MAG: hypothetical protein ACFCVC_12015 [Acidimicrobiia bacterium]